MLAVQVIFVGGSYRSILGNQQAVQFPSNLDALILTDRVGLPVPNLLPSLRKELKNLIISSHRYTNDDQFLIPFFSANALAAPAAVVDAAKWADLPYGCTCSGAFDLQRLIGISLDLTNANSLGRRVLYSGHWDNHIFDHDELVRGTVIVGEVSRAIHPLPVFVPNPFLDSPRLSLPTLIPLLPQLPR